MFRSRTLAKAVGSSVRWITDTAGGQGSMKGSKQVFSGERGVNQVTLLGRAGQDPQVRGSVENPATIFSLATSFSLKTRDGEYVQKTEWHRITVFRPVLKDLVSQFVKKGDRVCVMGSISYNQYTDRNGVNQRAANIIADEVINVSRPMRQSSANETASFADVTGDNEVDDVDEAVSK